MVVGPLNGGAGTNKRGMSSLYGVMMTIVIFALGGLLTRQFLSSNCASGIAPHSLAEQSGYELVEDCSKSALLLRTYDLIVAPTAPDPSFLITIINPARDTHVSKHLYDTGSWDAAVQNVLVYILRHEGCWDHVKQRRNIFIDVGANLGFFGFMAASQGCETHFYEPQQVMVAAMKGTVCLNSFESVATVHRGVVSLQNEHTFPKVTNHARYQGNFGGLNGFVCDQKAFTPEMCETVQGFQLDVDFHRVDKKQIVVLKIDVEQMENEVFATAWTIIAAHKARNILFELTPTTDNIVAYQTTLRRLKELGYFIANVPYAGVLDYGAHHFFGNTEHTIGKAIELNDTDAFTEHLRVHGDWRGGGYADIWATLDQSNFRLFNEEKIQAPPHVA